MVGSVAVRDHPTDVSEGAILLAHRSQVQQDLRWIVDNHIVYVVRTRAYTVGGGTYDYGVVFEISLEG